MSLTVRGNRQRKSNVHLTKLSPHMQKLIVKPLLERSTPLYRPPVAQPKQANEAKPITPADDEKAAVAEDIQH